MKRGKSKKSQSAFGMSFGMIFSIILIIFFIVVAFIAIRAFLNAKKCAQVGIFVDEFQTEVDKTWNSQSSSFEFRGRLPTKIEYVCFADLDESITATRDIKYIGDELGVYQGNIANMFFYPTNYACNMVYHEIDHLDINNIILEKNNPYCIVVNAGNIDIQIEKDFNEKLVSIE
mgnify:CR=1 FL=1